MTDTEFITPMPVTALLHTLESWSMHQDYLWFLAALAWLSVAVGAWPQVPRGAQRRYLALFGVAVGCTGSAVVELVLLSQDLRGPYVGWDRAMGVAQGATTAFLLLWSAPRCFAGAAWRVALSLLGLAGALAFLRHQWPVAGGLMAALAQLLALRGAWANKPARAFRWMLLALAFWPLLATHGPIAHAVGMGRINRDLSLFAYPASAVLFVGGIAASLGVWRERLADAAGGASAPELRVNFRRSLAVLAAWLLIGFGLIIWNGRHAREDYETSLLARARTAARALDEDLVRRTLGTNLRAGRIETRTYPSGRRTEVIHLPLTGSQDFDPLRRFLTLVVEANPELRYAYILVPRAGIAAIAAIARDRQPRNEWRLVSHALTTEELSLLAARRTFIAPPQRGAFGQWGAFVAARSPIVDSVSQQALGWLVLEVPASRWLTIFARARLQTMVLVGLGVGLWGLGLAYELRRSSSEIAARRAAAAAEADRLKSTFLATVSHELRTPIQSVLGYGELLAGEKLPLASARWVEALRTHGQVMLRLVNDLIDYGAMQSGAFRLQPRPAPLRSLLEECVAAVRPSASRALAVHTHLVEPLPQMVLTDPVRLRQLLLNLLANAVKFTPAGEVHLTVRSLGPCVAGEQIEFIVRDTGPGIPLESRAALFKPFSRVHAGRDVEGAGLGLAIAASLAASMNGSVRYDDAPGGGAMFTAVLPLPPAVASDATQPISPNRSWDGVTVLVVEDNSLVRELLLAFFERQGASVVCAPDGEGAIELCAGRDFDLVLMDWMLPGKDGLAVTRELRRRSSDPLRPFIIGVSAHAMVDSFERGRAAGMNAFLAKPFSFAELVHVASQAPDLPLPASLAPTDAALFAGLQARFAEELPGLVAEITAAGEAGDWPRARARAHYLKNSADVVGALPLARACQELCSEPSAPSDRLVDLVRAVSGAARHPFGVGSAAPPAFCHPANSKNN